jgi:uncharacterized membrane protein
VKKISTRFIVQSAVIGALYATFTLILAPFSFGYMQVRVSEALTVLAFFTPAAVPGLFIGCLLANIIVFGSLATLLAAYLTHKIQNKYLAPLPPIIVNGLVIGYIVSLYLNIPLWLGMLSVSLGEAIACYFIGLPLILLLEKHKGVVFNLR